MSSMQYKDQNIQNYKKILIVLFVMTFILFLFLFSLLIVVNRQNKETAEVTSEITTVKDVVEYYKSTYIKENESTERRFYMDYYVKFRVLPYEEDDTSNEEYYNNILEDSAKILRYSSFRMLDEENELVVQVICDGTKITSIIINDIEDYFIYMNSQIELKEYVKIENTEFSITSPILEEIIKASWTNVIDFGTRDSIYDQYYIYINQGLKVRTIQNEIYNIIFTKNYNSDVINNLFPGIDLSSVERSLGTPSFELDEPHIIGYKNDRIYVFFSKDEISVYRNLDTDVEDFLELSNDLISEKLDLLDFMNNLTDMWPNYSEYTYTASSIFIAYPLKGIEIKLNYDDISGILVYNNIKSSISRIENYLKDTDFVSRLKIDAVFEAEKRRVIKKNSETTMCDEYIESLDEDKKEIIGDSLNYRIYADADPAGNIYSMKFISKDDNRANRELNDYISYFMWISSNQFLYSKSGKGIYLYNLENGNVNRILEGSNEFELQGYKDGILMYDNNELEIQF